MTTSEKKVGIHYQTHGSLMPHSSFSTLPSTLSKMALKPSPLRLIKDVQLEQAPPVPVRSPLRALRTGNEHTALYPARSSSLSPAPFPCHRSSHYTMSVYSTNSDGHPMELNDTPPSSPPQTPQHQKRRSFFIEIDAHTRAEDLRDELGIIDDIYDMYADTEKVSRHEACIDRVESQMSFFELPESITSNRLSRTERRLQKEKAREKAARRLEGLKTEVSGQEMDFEDWLDLNSCLEARDDSHRIISLNSYNQHPLMSTKSQWRIQSSTSLSDISEGGERQSNTSLGRSREQYQSSLSKPEMVVARSSPQRDFTEREVNLAKFPLPPTAGLPTEFRPSLAILQERLQALMRDTISPRDHAHPAAPELSDQLAAPLSVSSASSLTTSKEVAHESLGLQSTLR